VVNTVGFAYYLNGHLHLTDMLGSYRLPPSKQAAVGQKQSVKRAPSQDGPELYRLYAPFSFINGRQISGTQRGFHRITRLVIAG
jgi:hypothetical protein